MKRKPIVTQLSEKFGGEWKAVRTGYGIGWYWVGPNGQEVRAYSQLSPQSPCDDETCITIYQDNHGHEVGSEGLIYFRSAPNL